MCPGGVGGRGGGLHAWEANQLGMHGGGDVVQAHSWGPHPVCAPLGAKKQLITQVPDSQVVGVCKAVGHLLVGLFPLGEMWNRPDSLPPLPERPQQLPAGLLATRLQHEAGVCGLGHHGGPRQEVALCPQVGVEVPAPVSIR